MRFYAWNWSSLHLYENGKYLGVFSLSQLIKTYGYQELYKVFNDSHESLTVKRSKDETK